MWKKYVNDRSSPTVLRLSAFSWQGSKSCLRCLSVRRRGFVAGAIVTSSPLSVVCDPIDFVTCAVIFIVTVVTDVSFHGWLILLLGSALFQTSDAHHSLTVTAPITENDSRFIMG